jgi:hypothetical protein
MKNANTQQLTELYTILNNIGIMHVEEEIVSNFTEGRSKRCNELLTNEVQTLIDNLSGYDLTPKIKSRILFFAYQAGIILDNSPENEKTNILELNNFLSKNGVVKKRLDQMNIEDALNTFYQFEKIAINVDNIKNGINTVSAAKYLLNEFDLNFNVTVS